MVKRKKKTTESKRLTPRQLALLNDLSKGRSITPAARDAGAVFDGCVGQRVPPLAKRTPETTSQLLEERGLGLEVLIEDYLKPLLKASSRKFFSSQGRMMDKRVSAADKAIWRALDVALRLHGAYPAKPRPAEPVKNGRTVSVIILDVPRPSRPAPGVPIKPAALPMSPRTDYPHLSEYPDSSDD
jgi:hypothetical protein